eukprot:TRINITY_DN24068_c0_g1_i1.p1 TRINITY_DN24068_c0_g1~~TRINITY_DN24068_c0_g1_i1.p1  ORF type:complete len:493 (+),score=73.28 TRINITY_DN24068_c0_g1_i1:106-1479(+)
MIGYCGARPEEIVEEEGISSCAQQDCTIDSSQGQCLCVFDIDRTLTGRQGDDKTCFRNRVMPGIHDNGYGSGNLTLSALASIGIKTTFCGGCYLGICSAGDADGDDSEERKLLLEQVLRSSPFDDLKKRVPSASEWSWGDKVVSPLVLGSPNRLKQYSVDAIRRWYRDQGICISRDNVHFFGDRRENMKPFGELSFNAHEISCGSRDPVLYGGSGMVGYCGARPEEIVKEEGISNCVEQECVDVDALHDSSLQTCLCVFDIDRTLTGKQDEVDSCPRNRIMPGVHDNGYGSGNLTLSELASVGINTTFCGGCYLGICSAGNANGDGSEERKVLLEQVLRSSPFDELKKRVPSASRWSWSSKVASPLVLGSPNRLKQHSVEEIRRWYSDQGICISSTNVHFFDDRSENLGPFQEMNFNAREISCGSRDPVLYGGSGMVGFCGAKPEEIARERGIFNCA